MNNLSPGNVFETIYVRGLFVEPPAIPAPAAFALFGLGLLGLVAVRRKA